MGPGVAVAEGGGQGVGAVLGRGAAQRPERVLQAVGERDEALAAEDDLGMFPARIGEREVIQAVFERPAGDADTEIAGVGEVGQGLLAGLMDLAEDDFLLGAVQGLPGAHPALQGAADLVTLGTAALKFLQDGDRAQPRMGLKQRQDIGLPNPGERVGSAAAAAPPELLLRRQPGVPLDPISGADADPRLGGGGLLGKRSTEVHVESHLLVCDGGAGHGVLFLAVEDPCQTRSIATAAVSPAHAAVEAACGRAVPDLQPPPPFTFTDADPSGPLSLHR